MTTTSPITCRAGARYVAVLLVMLGSLATGCRSSGQDGTQETSVEVDLETSREQFRAEFREIEQMLKPAEFKLSGSETEIPMSCELPNGDEGRSYLFDTRKAEGYVEDPEATASMIAEHWRSKGHDVLIGGDAGFRVTARTSQGGVLVFIVSEPAMTYSGETPCVPA